METTETPIGELTLPPESESAFAMEAESAPAVDGEVTAPAEEAAPPEEAAALFEEAECAEPTPADEGQALPAGGSDEDYRAVMQADLAALSAVFPRLRGESDLSSLRNPARYGPLRVAGLTPSEAYLATEGLALLGGDNRTHLAPSLGRAQGGAHHRMTVGEWEEARALFPQLSDKEIEGLWRRTAAIRPR